MKPNRPLYLLAAALTLCPFAHAQFGAYGMFTESHLSGIQSSPLKLAGVAYNDSVNPSGFTGGLQYDFYNLGPARIGADLRGSLFHTSKGPQALASGGGSVGTGATADSVLGGIRASFHTPVDFVRPYVQASAGLGRSDFGLATDSVGRPALRNSFEYHGFAGVDLRVIDIMDFRAVELGYGAITSAGHTYPIASISTGVVFHLPTAK